MALGTPFEASTGGLQPVNITQVGGSAITLGQKTMANSFPVVLSSDQSSIPVTQSGTWNVGTVTTVTTVTNVSQINGVGPTFNSSTTVGKQAIDTNILSILGTAPTTAGKLDIKGADGDVFVRQATASNLNATVIGTGTFAVQATLQTQTDTTMVGGVNIKEINAVTPLMGNGGTGTGSQRVTISNDNTGIANWGQGATGSAVPTGAVFQGISDGTNLRGVLQAANALNSTGTGLQTAQIIGQFDDVTPTSITENQFGNLRMSANRNLYTTIRDAAGNERGLNVDANGGIPITIESAQTLATVTTVSTVSNVSQINGIGPTFNSTTFSGKEGLDVNLLGTLGTAFTTAGFVDIKGADGNVFVRQSTASNLLATVNNRDGAGNALTTNSTTFTSKFALDGNLLGTLGTAFSTAGKVDVKGADGDVFVRQTTASNLKAQVVSGDATGSAVPANAYYQAFDAATALPTAATAGNLTGAMSDKFGRQIVIPQAMRDLVSSQTTTITGNTETTIVTAAASVFNDIVSFNIVNTSATPVRIDIRDATLGSIITQFYCPATDMRGIAYPIPLPQTTANNNWTATVSTSVTDIRITVQFVKNK